VNCDEPGGVLPGSSSAPPSSRKLPEVAETPRNSLSWTILQGTSLLSGFYSATLLVTSRKQGISLQNMGGGTPSFLRSLIQGWDTAVKLES
jgi:hypothetical protein